MTFIDICAGIGGFRLGLEQAGHKCIGFVEYNKYAVKSYRAMYDTEGEFYHDDITTIKSGDIPKADAWCFGFPCQDISIAGKQAGLNGSRSGIYFDIINLVKSKKEEDKPRWLLIENVKNLFSIDGGWGFARVLSELDEAGYDAEWQLLNSKNFGVPQKRERVFIVGNLRTRGGGKVFPISGADSAVDIKIIGTTNPKRHSTADVHGVDGIMTTLCSRDCNGAKQIAIPFLTPDRAEKRQNGRIFKENGEPMFTLTSQDRHGVMVIDDTQEFDGPRYYDDETPTLKANRSGLKVSDGFRVRKLTPKEYFRLQGFPDEYFERAASVNSNSQLYKQAGNAVTVNVIYEIGKKIKELEDIV